MNPTKLCLRSLMVGIPLALASLAVSAQTPPPGRLLASQCSQCHGTNGNGPGFDSIAGKSAGEIYSELQEMKARPVEGIMDRQARGYTDAQMRLISEYLSTLPGNGGD